MTIPKYTARRPMEVIPSGAKAWPEAMSREAGAMAGFGGTLMSVAQKWQDERDNAEISRLQSAINNFQYTTLRQLEDDWRAGKFTNADQFKQAEDDYIKARDKMVNSLVKGKRGRISDRVSEYAEQNKASDTANFYRNLFPKEKEFMSVEGLKIVEGYKLQGDRDKALMAIEQYKHWFGLPKAELLKANLDADIAVLQHQNFLEQVTVDTRGMSIKDALDYINKIPRTAITEPERNGLIAQRKAQEALEKEAREVQREKDRDEISKSIRGGGNAITIIEGSSLEESEQWTWAERYRAEIERIAKGQEIITDNEVRSSLYSGIFQVLTGAKTKKEVLDEAKAARHPGVDEKGKFIIPTLNETEYQSFERSINAQYEQAYLQGMSRVDREAEGLLLNPDSLGYIKNAPIRYKILGNFRKAWLQWISEQGDKLKISEIYPEGLRMASTHQISDEEAERQEIEMNKRLKEREATIWPKMPTDKKILEAAKKVAGESAKTKPELPQPKTKEEYDKLESGTKYIDPKGVVRTKG